MGKWREYRFVLILGVVALTLTSIPYAAGAAMTSEERIFGGFVYAVEDCYSYLAKMRQGAEGGWLFHLAYTPEPHPGSLFFLFHLLLGKTAASLPIGALTPRMVWVYHLARWVFGLALLATLYRFITAFTERLLVRRLTWSMVTFGSGLGWLLVSLGRSYWLDSLPLDFILPEGFTFLVLYAFPHIALGRTLLLWGILSMLEAWEAYPSSEEQSRWSTQRRISRIKPLTWALVAGVQWLLMGLIVPFYVAVAWTVTGASWILLALRERHPSWSKASLACVAGLVSAPIVLYSVWRFTSDPVYAAWSAQNQILSPHPLHYLAAYGVLLSLAAFAVREAWSTRKPTWLALAWVGAVPLLVYLPFNLQRRLVESVQIPLSLLAAIGLLKITKFGGSARNLRSKLTMGIVLLSLLPTNVILVAGGLMSLRGRPSPIFRDKREIAALDWLDQRVATSDVVLCSYQTGNYLPARVGARAFVGHGPESVNANKKRAQVTDFFGEKTDRTWRLSLLREHSVDYVFVGPEEKELGSFDPSTAYYLHPIYRQDGYTLYEVVK